MANPVPDIAPIRFDKPLDTLPKPTEPPGQPSSRAPLSRYIFCVGCCAPSERWWFRWVLPAQPAIALLLYLYYYVSWN